MPELAESPDELLPDYVRPAGLWRRVDRLVDRAPRLSDLQAHGLQYLAVRRWRSLNRPVPPELEGAERTAAVTALLAPLVLQRILAAVAEPILLMKGPEIAHLYPDPALRPLRDLDLLSGNAPETHRRLIDAGFRRTGNPSLYVDLHHLQPLVWPGVPLLVEIHSRPKWVDESVPPPTDELLAAAQPSALSLPGLLALPAEAHAVIVAAHSWAHVPLGRLIHIVDIAALMANADRDECAEIARKWGLERVWRTMHAVSDSLLGDEEPRPGRRRRRPIAGNVWARHLWTARERTVLETHLERWLAPFSALPPTGAVRLTTRAIRREIQPRPDESGRAKLRRTLRAFANAFTRTSDHDRALARGQEGRDGDPHEAPPAR